MAVNFVFMSNHRWVVNNVCKREVGHKWRKDWMAGSVLVMDACWDAGLSLPGTCCSCGTFMFTDILGI